MPRRRAGRSPHPDDSGMPDRDALVLNMLEQGLSADDIARELRVSVKRVRRMQRQADRHHVAGDETSGDRSPSSPAESAFVHQPQFSPPARGGRQRKGPAMVDIDLACALYLDPTLSMSEIADAVGCDPAELQAIIDQSFPGVLRR